MKAITKELMNLCPKRSNQSKDWMNVIEIDGLENFIETYNQIVSWKYKSLMKE